MTEPQPVSCPFCAAASATLISLFGSQLLLSQYRCTVCGSYFEGLRQDRNESEAAVVSSRGGEDACQSS